MIDLNTSAPFCLQVKSSAAFDGATPPGYAFFSYVNGGVTGIFRAREMGVAGNHAAGPPPVGLSFQMVKGAPAALTVPLVRPVPLLNSDGMVAGYQVNIYLVTDGTGTITSTLQDVAAALAAYETSSPYDVRAQDLGIPAGQPCPIRLTVTAPGVIPSPDATPHNLAGGVDPVMSGSGSLVRLDMGATAAGLWAIRANEPHEILQILSSGGAATLKLCNLDDGLGIITGESIDVTPILGGEVQEAAGKVIFDPATQGLSVTAPAGVVQVWMQRKTRRQ